MNCSPGPWTVSAGEDLGVYLIAEIRDRHSRMKAAREVTAEDEANCHMLSAALDMYAALKQAMAFLESEVSQRQGSGLAEYIEAAGAVLRECECAIAKAERG